MHRAARRWNQHVNGQSLETQVEKAGLAPSGVGRTVSHDKHRVFTSFSLILDTVQVGVLSVSLCPVDVLRLKHASL